MLEKRKFYINGVWVNPKKQKDIECRKRANHELSKIFYSGSKKIGKF